MANVHYRLLDKRRFSISGSYIVSDGVADNLVGYYIVLSPAVVNSLGGTPTSTIAAATIEGSSLRQTSFDPLQPASDFALSSWTLRGWANAESDLAAFKTMVLNWVLSNLDNSTINPGGNPFNFYLLDTTISGTHYFVPVIYIGADGEILNSIPVAPRVVIAGGYASEGIGMALDRSDRIWAWGWIYDVYLGLTRTFNRSPFRLPSGVTGNHNSTVLLLDSNSYAWAWGQSVGADRFQSVSPVSVVGGKQWLFLNTAGQGSASFGIDLSSYGWAWCNNSGNRGIADGTTNSQSSPVSIIGDRQWKFLAGGDFMGMGIDILGYAWAWGAGTNGVLGNNSVTNTSSPVSVVGDKQWFFLAGGQYYCYGLDLNSYAWAWGQNHRGQLGDGTTINRSSPVSVLGGRQAFFLRASWASGGLLDSNSYAWCWGDNSSAASGLDGICGDGTTINRSSPVSVLGGRQFFQLAGGMVALDQNSYAWAWGSGQIGRLGNNTTSSVSSPISVLGDRQFSSLWGFTSNTIIAQEGEYLWGWGLGANGNLAKTDNTNTSSPVSVGLSPNLPQSSPMLITAIPDQFKSIGINPFGASGYYGALDQNSYAWAWGVNGGQIGDGTTTSRSTPVSVLGGRQFKQLVVNNPSFALDLQGYAWAWGNNTSGRLGNNSAVTGTSSPVSVVGGLQFLKLAYEGNAIVALDTLSYAWAWGNGNSGRIGDGSAVNRSSPVSVLGGRQYLDISLQSAVDSLGYAWCWGSNTTGAAGDGTTINRSSPVSVLGGRRFRSITRNYSSNQFNVALDENSYAWAWGFNSFGNLADGTTINRSSPVSVLGGYQFDRVEARNMNIVAIRGSLVYAWGQNFSYQLANGGDMTSSPVAIAAISDISK